MQNITTFGLNKINLLFENNSFRPSYIVSVNNHVLDQNKDFYTTTDIPLFLGYRAVKSGIPLRDNIFFQATNEGFATKCNFSIGLGSTVTYVALQIAYHLGFHSVALVGCDHYFETKGEADKLVEAGETDPNHFDPRYFSNGVKWNLPDLINSERGYLLAKKYFEASGRKVVNCTDGGNLETFPRMELKEFIDKDL